VRPFLYSSRGSNAYICEEREDRDYLIVSMRYKDINIRSKYYKQKLRNLKLKYLIIFKRCFNKNPKYNTYKYYCL
jgi:hypothetical protein